MFAAGLSRWNSLGNTCSLEGKIHSRCHCSVFMFWVPSSLSYQYYFCYSLAETYSTSLIFNVCVWICIYTYVCIYCCILFALSSYSSPVSLCDGANTSALPAWCKDIKEHSDTVLDTSIHNPRRPCYTSGLSLSFQHSCPSLVSPLKHNALVDDSKQWLFSILPCFV